MRAFLVELGYFLGTLWSKTWRWALRKRRNLAISVAVVIVLLIVTGAIGQFENASCAQLRISTRIEMKIGSVAVFEMNPFVRRSPRNDHITERWIDFGAVASRIEKHNPAGLPIRSRIRTARLIAHCRRAQAHGSTHIAIDGLIACFQHRARELTGHIVHPTAHDELLERGRSQGAQNGGDGERDEQLYQGEPSGTPDKRIWAGCIHNGDYGYKMRL